MIAEPTTRPAPICPRHDDPLDPPMVSTGTKDGFEVFKCPDAGCNCENHRPLSPLTKPTTQQ